MKQISIDPGLNPTLRLRHERTLSFLQSVIPAPARLLDLGTSNPLSDQMKALGYEVTHTTGDLDEHPNQAGLEMVDVVTAFEILEHLVAPLHVLRAVRAPILIATVPLRLWFTRAYRSAIDPWDRHYHEFEDWQFDWLLEKAGWEIQSIQKWTSPILRIGLRPILRKFSPRYYAVHATRQAAE